MADEATEFETGERRRRRWPVALAGLALVLLALIAATWLQRRELAADLIDRELARRGVAARYQVTEVGPRLQRLENVVIGDPARPDAVAARVDVLLSLGLRAPRVERLIVRGAVINARIDGGRLRLGELDKLLPPPTGAPFRLPDLDVDLAGVGLRIDGPAGRVGLAMTGSGNLSDGFRGQVVGAAPRLASGGCDLREARARFRLVIAGAAPQLVGPASAGRVTCGAAAARQVRFALEATLAPALDSWRGRSGVAIAELQSGASRVRGLTGSVSFAGTAAATDGRLQLASRDVRAGDVAAANARLGGRYRWRAQGGLAFAGQIGAGAIDVAPLARGASDSLNGLRASPLGPIATQLAAAIMRAGASIRGEAGVVAVSAGGGALRLRDLRLAAATGARLQLGKGQATYYAGPGRLRFAGDLAIAGGGLPAARLTLRSLGNGWDGRAEIAPLAAAGAALRLAPIRISGADGVTRFATTALISGPFSGGRVEGLMLPLTGRVGKGGFRLGENCTAARFSALTVGSFRAGATSLPLCPDGPALIWSDGGSVRAAARVAGPRLAGRIGATPVAVTADRLRVSADGFAASAVALRLGGGQGMHQLRADRLDGRLSAAGLAGRFASLSGRLANVPLLLDEAAGEWRLIDGRLALSGVARLSDAAAPARFHPLAVRDLRLGIAGSAIDAAANLIDPETGTRIAHAALDHDLALGTGRAVLDVAGIAFGPDYQPEQLTRLTTGIVALVEGSVSGRGEIAWSPAGVASSGRFTTARMNLAAPFGPVEGLSTSITFTDLLGLASAPAQEARVALVRAGIDVYDGTIRYQLLPDLKVRIESGRWPYSGGELLLDETILDFAAETAKHLTFQVRGLDGARFISSMEFENIAATGTFDGTIPMIFDRAGGRIVGGRLAARPEGGTLSYIGELTDKELGVYGKLAFDALKALRYSKLAADLNGALDGEFVAGIELDGIARDAPALGGIAGYAIRQLAKIPFEFNINVRGPFRTLLATARSLEDPSLLIQDVLPQEIRDAAKLTTGVQTRESEPVPE